MVSPMFVVLLAAIVPNHRRIGVPALSHNSTPPTVTAGIPVNEMANKLLVMEPAAAVPHELVVG